jgi:hypothetical protein
MGSFHCLTSVGLSGSSARWETQAGRISYHHTIIPSYHLTSDHLTSDQIVRNTGEPTSVFTAGKFGDGFAILP